MTAITSDQGFPARPPHGFAAPSLEDPAFQPQSNYIFDEATEEGFGTMHQNLALNMNDFEADDASTVDTMDPMQSQYNDPLALNASLPSPDTAAWHPARATAPALTLQGSIIDSRRGLVNQHYGQITPPNDTDSEKADRLREMEANAAAAAEASNAKSERARNAANTRHARKNQTRKDSSTTQTNSESATEQEPEGSHKREKYREKNRLAAAKCRAKKKSNTEDLESLARAAQGRNRQLKEEELSLRDELSFLRNCALEHIAGGCRNNRLLSYNQMKAEEAARTAQMSGQPTHSPSMEHSGSMMAHSPANSSGVDGNEMHNGRRASLHQLHSQAFGTGSGLQGNDIDQHMQQQQTMSPMSDLDHPMYDFARPTTQQALADFYAQSGGAGGDFGGAVSHDRAARR